MTHKTNIVGPHLPYSPQPDIYPWPDFSEGMALLKVHAVYLEKPNHKEAASDFLAMYESGANFSVKQYNYAMDLAMKSVLAYQKAIQKIGDLSATLKSLGSHTKSVTDDLDDAMSGFASVVASDPVFLSVPADKVDKAIAFAWHYGMGKEKISHLMPDEKTVTKLSINPYAPPDIFANLFKETKEATDKAMAKAKEESFTAPAPKNLNYQPFPRPKLALIADGTLLENYEYDLYEKAAKADGSNFPGDSELALEVVKYISSTGARLVPIAYDVSITKWSSFWSKQLFTENPKSEAFALPLPGLWLGRRLWVRNVRLGHFFFNCFHIIPGDSQRLDRAVGHFDGECFCWTVPVPMDVRDAIRLALDVIAQDPTQYVNMLKQMESETMAEHGQLDYFDLSDFDALMSDDDE